MFDKKYLDLISLDKFTNYLRLNNWTQNLDFPNKNLLVFDKLFDDINFTIVIPSKETFKDFKIRLYDSINMLSDLEENDSINIINKILEGKSIVKDIFSIRLISDNTSNGTISLDNANNAIYGIKRLISSAILNEENPQPYIKGSTKELSDSLNHYVLGQTSIGSYIFNIEIENSDCEQVFVNNEGTYVITSKERRVISRIQNGINDVINIKNDLELKNMLKTEYKKGLNANMCDALLQFNDINENLKVETSIIWGNDEFIPDNVPQKITLHPKDFFTLSDISSKYKEVKPEVTKIVGNIINLYHSGNERIITIKAKYNSKYRNFRIIMNNNDYLIACNAHTYEKQISITGEIQKIGKFTYLNNYSNLIILDGII